MAITERVIPEWPPPPKNPTLGQRLRRAREHAGISTETMAEHLDVSVRAIRSWETDHRRPRELVGIIQRWAEATGVPEAWLLGVNLGWISLKRRRQRKTESFPSRPPDVEVAAQTG